MTEEDFLQLIRYANAVWQVHAANWNSMRQCRQSNSQSLGRRRQEKKHPCGVSVLGWNQIGGQTWNYTVRTEASDVLRRYTTALKVLLERGELKASDTRPESDQQKLTNFNIRDQLKNNLYPNTASMVSDEPILYPTGEGVPTMGNARRYHDDRELELIESADLQQFLAINSFWVGSWVIEQQWLLMLTDCVNRRTH